MVLLLAAFFISGCASVERRVQKVQAQYPQWDEATVQRVAQRDVGIGMNQEMVQAAFGKPDAISRKGDREMWGYAIWIVPAEGRPHYKKFVYFVTFENGAVVRTEGDPGKMDYLSWYF